MGSDAEPRSHGPKHRVSRQLAIEPPAAGRTVGQKADATALTVFDHPLRQRLPEERIQPILHAGYLDHRLRLPNLRDRHVGETHPADLSVPLEIRERPYAVAERNPRIGGMQLIEVDASQPQGSERTLTGRAEVLRPAIGFPAAAGPRETALSRHHHRILTPLPL